MLRTGTRGRHAGQRPGQGSADEPGPGGGAPAVPGGAFTDERPLGIPGEVSQRVADLMEDRYVGVRALEVADEVEITATPSRPGRPGRSPQH